MEHLIYISTSIAIILLGFLIAEIQNTYLGKQEKGTKKIFSFIGVVFTQNDIQRLLLALFIGIAVMVLKEEIIAFTGKKIDNNMTFFIIGYMPSTIMILAKAIFNKKLQ